MAPKAAPAGSGGDGEGAGQDQEQDGGGGNTRGFMVQMLMIFFVMNIVSQRQKPAQNASGAGGPIDVTAGGKPSSTQFRNVYGDLEECELWVHFSLNQTRPSLDAVMNDTLASEEGFSLLWHERVWYEQSPAPAEKNVSVGPLPDEFLDGTSSPYVHATLLRTALRQEKVEAIPAEQVVGQSLPLVAHLRELNLDAGAGSLFGDEEEAPRLAVNTSAVRLPYFKSKVEVRPLFDHTVQTLASLKQGPFKNIRVFRELGVYQPMLYLSDFWLLEKDFVPLNQTLKDKTLNLTLSYSICTLWTWSIQEQMKEQWKTQDGLGLTDPQRDSFMLKRMVADTNPYLLAFSGAFIGLHTIFSLLAFKNDIQFWRQNESMQGLSARSMMVSFACQLITTLYLLDSQEASRLILFNIVMDLSLATWKLRKAVKVELKPSFPFMSFEGQTGYEDKGTSKYDEEALTYMFAALTPAFIGYVVRSAIYGKHRGWYSFLVGASAGGVYTFGFVMMTPQLYINYKLQSVEHLPWRALTYKAMNTFVDDVAALLIDMPLMHRLSCFRDDIVFFIYLYQRWKYRVDKTRPSVWVEGDSASSKEAAGGQPSAAPAPVAAAPAPVDVPVSR